jgi:5-methylcytosine-specific restriction endonuclease McrA
VARKFSEIVQMRVRQRAGFLCEYCHTNERWQYVRFTIDHLKAISEGGEDDWENLALACFHCNRRKSNKQSALDRETGIIVPLFNPRVHAWAEHFIWSADGLQILPLTAIGRATVELLALNRERILRIRAADVSVNRHPPEGDPIQIYSSSN